MHEVAMALSVIQIVKETAEVNHLKQVSKIMIRRGALSGILEESFLFAFESLKNENSRLLKTTQIEFTNLEADATCLICHQQFKLGRYKKACPYCGGKELYYPSAYDFFVESIEGE